MPKTLYFLSFIALFCLIIQYHVSNTRSVSPFPSSSGGGISSSSNGRHRVVVNSNINNNKSTIINNIIHRSPVDGGGNNGDSNNQNNAWPPPASGHGLNDTANRNNKVVITTNNNNNNNSNNVVVTSGKNKTNNNHQISSAAVVVYGGSDRNRAAAIVANIDDSAVIDANETEFAARRIIDNIRFDQSIVKTVGETAMKSMAIQIAMEILSDPEYLRHSSSAGSRKHRAGGRPTGNGGGGGRPTIYVVTPTYKRPEQIAELTRLSQTLMHVDNLQWLVVEDATSKSRHVSNLLKKTNMKAHHLIAPMPDVYKRTNGAKPKGVSNRNQGIKWIREHAQDGVMYFADDDNTYDLDLFNEMRYTRKVAMWPVGLCSSTQLSTPIIRNGTVISFYDGWHAGRKFPVDMAGFAVNVKFLHERPKAIMPYIPGYEEDGFLKSLAPFESHEIEPKADDCTKILVWHTQTKKPEPAPTINLERYPNTNLVKLKESML